MIKSLIHDTTGMHWILRGNMSPAFGWHPINIKTKQNIHLIILIRQLIKNYEYFFIKSYGSWGYNNKNSSEACSEITQWWYKRCYSKENLSSCSKHLLMKNEKSLYWNMCRRIISLLSCNVFDVILCNLLNDHVDLILLLSENWIF